MQIWGRVRAGEKKRAGARVACRPVVGVFGVWDLLFGSPRVETRGTVAF